MNKKILIVFLGNISHDSRSLKLIRSLREQGFQIEAICSLEPGEVKLESPGITYVKLRKWSRAFFKIIEFYIKALPIALRTNADWVIASDLFALPIAWIVSFKGAKLIYDSREFYASLASTSKNKIKQIFISIFEKFFVSRAKIILTVNQSLNDFISSKFKNKKIIIIRNLPTLRNPESSDFKIDIELPDITLLYLGNFHPGRGFKIYFDLVKKLSSDGIKSKLLLIGKGELKDKLEKEIASQGLSEIATILGPYLPNQNIRFPAATKPIGLCIIEPLSLSYIYSLPNKIFEYMKNSIPFVASGFPEIKAITEKYKVGILANPENFDEIYNAVRRLIDDDILYSNLKENCKNAILDLNWENEIKKLYELLNA